MLGRDVKDVAVLVFEGDIFLGAVGGLDFFGADYPADTVRLVDCVIPHLGRDEHIPALAADTFGFGRFCIEIARADYRQLALVQDKAPFEGRGKDGHAVKFVQSVGQADGGNIFVREQLLHLRRAGIVPAPEHYAVAAAEPVFDVRQKSGKAVEIFRRGRRREIVNLQRLEKERLARKGLKRGAAETRNGGKKFFLVRILLDRKGKRLAARVQAVKSFLKFFV